MPKTGLANNFRSLLYDFTSRTLRATAQYKALGTIATNESFAIKVLNCVKQCMVFHVNRLSMNKSALFWSLQELK